MTRTTDSAGLRARIDTIRRFNRFYTRRIGVLGQALLKSPYSLAEARVLYELANWSGDGAPAANEIARLLGLDPGYLSRMLQSFSQKGLVARTPSAFDGRRSLVALTGKGRKAFAQLDTRSHDQLAGMLGELDKDDQDKLVAAMAAIEGLLGAPGGTDATPAPAYLLRQHQPGDMGWIIHRHAALYAEEYGWDERFEALVAEIVAKFIHNYDPKRERCWLAERDGKILGSVCLVKQSAKVAKLRLLYVEPSARGLGIGKRLVAESERFARQAGYARISLWTQSILLAARGIYQSAGYRLIAQQPHEDFGIKLTGEHWELDLETHQRRA